MKKKLCILLAYVLIAAFNSGCEIDDSDEREAKETIYLGLLAEPESYKIAQGVTYSFGVTNAKANTYVVILDSNSTKGTWQSNDADGYYWSRTLIVDEGDDASGILIPQGGVTSEVQLWAEGVKVKTFKE